MFNHSQVHPINFFKYVLRGSFSTGVSALSPLLRSRLICTKFCQKNTWCKGVYAVNITSKSSHRSQCSTGIGIRIRIHAKDVVGWAIGLFWHRHAVIIRERSACRKGLLAFLSRQKMYTCTQLSSNINYNECVAKIKSKWNTLLERKIWPSSRIACSHIHMNIHIIYIYLSTP